MDIIVFRPKWVNYNSVDETKKIYKGKDIICLGLISLYKFEKDLYFEKVLEAAKLLSEIDNVSKEKIDLIATIHLSSQINSLMMKKK